MTDTNTIPQERIALDIETAPNTQIYAMDEASQLALDIDVQIYHGSMNKVESNLKAVGQKVKRQDMRMFPLSSLKRHPHWNVRIKNKAYYERVEVIANSMKHEGFKRNYPISVIIVCENGVDVPYFYGGHTRMDAVALHNSQCAEEDRITEIPAIIADKTVTLDDIFVDMIEGNDAAPLNLYERAVIWKRMFQRGWSVEALAERFGLSGTQINNGLRLVGAPLQFRQLVIDDLISPTMAVDLLRKHGDKALDVAMTMVNASQREGKPRATDRFSPGAAYKKLVKKHAKPALDLITEIRGDDGFERLSPEMQAKIEQLISLIEAAKQDVELPLASEDEGVPGVSADNTEPQVAQ